MAQSGSCDEDSFVIGISKDNLPSSYKNVIADVSRDKITIRSNLSTLEEINQWVEEYGKNTNTKWNCRNSVPRGERHACK